MQYVFGPYIEPANEIVEYITHEYSLPMVSGRCFLEILIYISVYVIYL